MSGNLEEKFNAQQIMFNLLLNVLGARAPGVIDDFCDFAEEVLRDEPKIPPATRAIMEGTVNGLRTARDSEEGVVRH